MATITVSGGNSRYFTVGGKTQYLCGAHSWYVVQDSTDADTVANPFDFTAYLTSLRGYGHNFLRFWVWESPRAEPLELDATTFSHVPWARSGTSGAADGGNKFDLTTFNSTYFSRLRARVEEAIAAGFVCGIQLFQGWSVGPLEGSINPGTYHPWRGVNNINSIDVDANTDGSCYEMHAQTAGTIRDTQRTYVNRVIDEVNDLDNIIYEIANETAHDTATHDWQKAMADYVVSYEAGKAKQHPVWLTATYAETPSTINDWMTGSNSNVKALSLHDYTNNLKDNMAVASGSKVLLTDTDHIWGIGGDNIWVWKSFLRGHNVLYMDSIDTGYSITAPALLSKLALGDTLRYANRLNLDTVTPDATLYMLSGSGQWLVLSPSGANITITLPSTTVYKKEWFMIDTREVVAQGSSVLASGSTTFIPPRATACVLLLNASITTAIPENAVLDNFNRADGGLGSNWTSPIENAATLVPRIVSNHVETESGAAYSDAYWNGATYGPDSEVFGTFVSVDGDEMDLFVRVQSPGTGSASGYLMLVGDLSNTVEIYKLTAGDSYATLTTATHNPIAGSVYTFRAVGSNPTVLTGYQDGAVIITFSDSSSPITSAGRIGLGMKWATTQLDNFGGGTLSAPTAPVILDKCVLTRN